MPECCLPCCSLRSLDRMDRRRPWQHEHPACLCHLSPPRGLSRLHRDRPAVLLARRYPWGRYVKTYPYESLIQYIGWCRDDPTATWVGVEMDEAIMGCLTLGKPLGEAAKPFVIRPDCALGSGQPGRGP